MKLSKKDIKALSGLVGTEIPEVKESSKQNAAMMNKLMDVFKANLKRTGTTENSISMQALKQMLEGIYWRFKVDWTGDEASYGKVFAKTFAGPLAKLRDAKQGIVAPGVGTAVKKPSKPRVPKPAVATAVSQDPKHLEWMAKQGLLGKSVDANIAEAQKMQNIHSQLEEIAKDLFGLPEVLLQFAGGRPFSVKTPHAKITDDNFFKVFSRQGNDTLIPMAEINLVEDPIVEVVDLPGGDFIIETRHGVVLTILHPVTKPVQAQVGGFTTGIMPDDIMEVL